jgi:hypothetical protein
MRHSALRNWLLRLSNWRSCQRSGATLSAGTAAAAATALVLPLDALVVLLPLLVLVDFVLLALLEVLVLGAALLCGAWWRRLVRRRGQPSAQPVQFCLNHHIQPCIRSGGDYH